MLLVQPFQTKIPHCKISSTLFKLLRQVHRLNKNTEHVKRCNACKQAHKHYSLNKNQKYTLKFVLCVDVQNQRIRQRHNKNF